MSCLATSAKAVSGKGTYPTHSDTAIFMQRPSCSAKGTLVRWLRSSGRRRGAACLDCVRSYDVVAHRAGNQALV